MRGLVVATGIAFYLVGLAMPSCRFTQFASEDFFSGFSAFVVGFCSLICWQPAEPFYWILSIAWLANPLIWLSLISTCFGRWRIAGIAAGCALVCCLQVLPWFGPLVAGCPGYWIWSGSAVVLLGSSLWLGSKGEESGNAHVKIVTSDDYLYGRHLTGKRFSEPFLALPENRHSCFLAESWQYILALCRSSRRE